MVELLGRDELGRSIDLYTSYYEVDSYPSISNLTTTANNGRAAIQNTFSFAPIGRTRSVASNVNVRGWSAARER